MKHFDVASQDARLRELVDAAVASVGAAEGSLMLLDDSGAFMRFVVSCSPVAARLLGTDQPVNRGFSGLCVSFQQPMIINQVDQDPQHDRTVDDRTQVRTRSIVVAPVSTSEQEFGVLTGINAKASGGFNHDDLETFLGYAQAVSQRLTDLDLGVADARGFG